MEYAGLNYPEAVHELAAMAGLQVPQETRLPLAQAAGPAEVTPQQMIEALYSATVFYREQLKRSTVAIDYLKGRGVSGEIAARFALGYAPDDWQALQAAFADYRRPVLDAAGLVKDKDGRRYDAFRDRIMFPIQDAKGNVIGFGGRVLGAGEPKYLNSPETALFEKGRELYGLSQARRAIREQKSLIVVEGYMDVIALAQHGVENVVATLGTATTEVHVHKLLRLADRVVFCFDGDNAGRAAAWRALENSLPALADRKQAAFLFLPEDHDPDTFVREFGAATFRARAADALPLSEFLLRELRARVDLRSHEGRAQLVERARPLVTAIRAPVLSLMLRKQLAEVAGLTQAELDRAYDLTPPRRPRGNAAPARVVRRAPSLARQLLMCIVADPALALDDAIDQFDEPSEEADAVAAVIALVRAAPRAPSQGALVEAFFATPHQRLMAELPREIIDYWGEDFDVGAEFEGVRRLLLKARQDRTLEALQQKLRRAEALTAEEQALYRKLCASR